MPSLSQRLNPVELQSLIQIPLLLGEAGKKGTRVNRTACTDRYGDILCSY